MEINCAVTTFFPALVLVYDAHVSQCLPCLSRAGAACKGGLRRCWARVRRNVILLTIVLSLIYSLFFFASVLAEIGPIGKRGQVSLLYRDCVNRAKEELDEMDEAQRLVDEQSVRKEGSVKRSWSRASVDDAAEEPPAAPVDL